MPYKMLCSLTLGIAAWIVNAEAVGDGYSARISALLFPLLSPFSANIRLNAKAQSRTTALVCGDPAHGGGEISIPLQ